MIFILRTAIQNLRRCHGIVVASRYLPADQTEMYVGYGAGALPLSGLPDGRLLLPPAGEQPLLRQEANGSLAPHADVRGFNIVGGNEMVADGAARKVADGLMFPNRLAISPDSKTLIVAESYSNQPTAYAITENGDLSNRRVWARFEESHPDGICLDTERNIWFADVASKQCVRVREGGDILQTVEAG